MAAALLDHYFYLKLMKHRESRGKVFGKEEGDTLKITSLILSFSRRKKEGVLGDLHAFRGHTLDYFLYMSFTHRNKGTWESFHL